MRLHLIRVDANVEQLKTILLGYNWWVQTHNDDADLLTIQEYVTGSRKTLFDIWLSDNSVTYVI